jgi:hypothetical protein
LDMTASKPYARIAITLPQADLASADRLAALQDRSRSWIIAEAVRRYAAEFAAAEASPPLGASRHAQLVRDAALTAEQRVHEAERVAAVGVADPASWETPRRFGSFDDFLEWQRAQAAR